MLVCSIFSEMPEGCEDPEDLAAEIEDMYPCQEIVLVHLFILTENMFFQTNQTHWQ